MDLCVNGNFHGACGQFCPPRDTLLEALTFDCALTVCVRTSFSLPSAAGGEIFDHCVSEELLPETQITRLIRQTLEGVHQLHQNNLVHLDLKVCAHGHTQTEETHTCCGTTSPLCNRTVGSMCSYQVSLCSSLSLRTFSSPAFHL